MNLSRRGFLKLSGGTMAASILGVGWPQARAYAKPLAIRYARETTSICPFCAVGCGVIVHTSDGNVINTEGDPEHPISRGNLCSKGSALYQLRHNEKRLIRPLYRDKGTTQWKEVSWEWTFEQIARRIKATRDASFLRTNDAGQKVNRTDAIASCGSAALDNEECYLLQKMLRSFGLVYIEHQARI